MTHKYISLFSGVGAFAIYLLLLFMLLFYFNTHDTKKTQHFVKKDEHRIQVSLSAPSVSKVVPSKPKKKVEKKKSEKKKPTKKKIEKKASPTKPKIKPTKVKEKLSSKVKKKIKKPVIKEKIVKKVKKKKEPKKSQKTKPKIINKPKKKATVKKTSDLFSDVNVSKKIEKKVHKVEKQKVEKNKMIREDKKTSASHKIKESLKVQKEKNSGIENKYFTKVQSLLETWPAQTEFAGERAMVKLYVKPTGMFEFKVKSKSNNVDFNLGLIDFLMQLQGIGFGPHHGGKTYEFEVEFIAKE